VGHASVGVPQTKVRRSEGRFNAAKRNEADGDRANKAQPDADAVLSDPNGPSVRLPIHDAFPWSESILTLARTHGHA
jgi:hypothetical protein